MGVESIPDLLTLVGSQMRQPVWHTQFPRPIHSFRTNHRCFQNSPERSLSRWLQPDNKQELVDLLTFHVLPEKVLSKDIKPFSVFKTVEGNPVHASNFQGRLVVGYASTD